MRISDWGSDVCSSDLVEELAQIKDAVDANYAQPLHHRRLSHIVELLRGGHRPHADDLWSRLRPWWGDGERAWLFDNEADATKSEEHTSELQSLMRISYSDYCWKNKVTYFQYIKSRKRTK